MKFVAIGIALGVLGLLVLDANHVGSLRGIVGTALLMAAGGYCARGLDE